MWIVIIFQINGVDLTGIPTKDPVKFCLQVMDILFTEEEMGSGRFKATRKRGGIEPKPPLDPKRVKLIDGNYRHLYLCIINWLLFFTDAIMFRFGPDKYNKSITRVRKQANQKCCDIFTLKNLKRKTVN